MNLFQLIILVALIGNTGLGLFVLSSNPKRTVNIAFFVLTFVMMSWIGAMFFCSLRHSQEILLFWVRQTSAIACFVPVGGILIQLAITNPDISIIQTLHKLRYWLLACFSIVLLCYSPFFVVSVVNPTEIELVPPTEYGWGFLAYIAFFIGAIIMLSVGFWKASRCRSGAQKVEIQFLQMGCLSSVIIGVCLVTFAEVLDNQEVSLFVPLSALALDGFVAYGIATRRILAASAVLQRVVALMAIYLTGLYILSVWLGRYVFRWFFEDSAYASYLLASLIVAFSVAPAHGWMQTFSHRLFASANLLNVNVVLERASQMFQEVSTEANLLTNFSELVADSFGTAQVVLLLPKRDGSYTQAHIAQSGDMPLRLESRSSTVQLLMRDREPFTIDTLQRMRPTALVTGALEEMGSLGAALVIGSFMRKEMKAILLLLPKKSGRIYDLRDQRALQLLSDQFAVALENANLYTAVQDGKIYNEILLDSLESGIVAVNEERRVTVFNQRAQKLTGLAEADVVGKSMSALPQALMDPIDGVFKTGGGFRDKDLSIAVGDDWVPIRASGSVFHSHTGEMLGVLLVFYDMTLLKKMEEQIRRSDRLSSIGTLAAGMAHEIKNPLVTIKTFTQLLPHQHNNEDFQKTFFDLVGQEVGRIDTIVNRLLNFARPAKAALKPVSLHEVVENSLRLIDQQLTNKDISLEADLSAKRHVIDADAEQLNQTFINFFLNAVHAMKPGGTLSVKTSVVKSSIQLDIQDTGCGIPPEQLSRVFDPFFTTKEDGVGLGLSVSHGIIQEHHALIDVESEVGKGTVFHLLFPLIKVKEISKR